MTMSKLIHYFWLALELISHSLLQKEVIFITTQYSRGKIPNLPQKDENQYMNNKWTTLAMKRKRMQLAVAFHLPYEDPSEAMNEQINWQITNLVSKYHSIWIRMKKEVDFIDGSIKEIIKSIKEYEKQAVIEDCPPNIKELIEETKAMLNTQQHDSLMCWKKIFALRTLFLTELRSAIIKISKCPIENSEEFQKTFDAIVKDRAMKEQMDNKLVMLKHVAHEQCI